MRYREYDPGHFAAIRKRLIQKKGDDFQRAFLEAVRDRDGFLRWLDKYLPVSDNQGHDLPCHDVKITTEEFRQPTEDLEQALAEIWKELQPREACRSSLWGYATASHIRRGIIEPHDLALNGQPDVPGYRRINDALESGEATSVDGVVRTILRRFSGLPEARGRRSVFVDCTFARAWWRERILNEVVDEIGSKPKAVSRILRESNTYWECFIDMVISRNSVLGDRMVRAVLIGALADYIDDSRYEPLRQVNGLKRCVRMIGAQAAWREFGVFGVEEIDGILHEEIFSKIISP